MHGPLNVKLEIDSYIYVICCNVKNSEVPVHAVKVCRVYGGVAPRILSFGAVGR